MLAWLAALTAVAADPPTWHADLLAGTLAPLSVGVRTGIELPARIRPRVGVGFFPRAYMRATNDIAVGAGWYDEATAAVLEASLSGALVVDPQLGWRPLPDHGWHFGAGLLVATASTDAVDAGALADASDIHFRRRLLERLSFEAGATAWLTTFETGWEVVIAERVVVDLTLGGAVTVASSASVSVDGLDGVGPTQRARLDKLIVEAEDQVARVIRESIRTPTVSVHVGYRFR